MPEIDRRPVCERLQPLPVDRRGRPARARRRLACVAGALGLLVVVGACSVLEQGGVRRPGVQLESTRIASLSLADVDLLLGFDIDNPNAFGIRFDRLDYRLSVAGEQLASGDQRRGVEIGAGRTTRAEIPVSIAWNDLARVYRSVTGGGGAGYRLDAGFWFDVPVLGAVRVPLTNEGRFPRLSMPRLSVADLGIAGIDASGARLELTLALDNPNDFPLSVDALDYSLTLAGSRVARVEDGGRMTVGREGRGSWTVPIRIDFAEAGRAVTQALTGGGTVDYRLDGSLTMSAGDEWLRATEVPVSSTGSLRLR